MRQTPRGAWYLNPYFHLAISALLLSAAEVCLKIGATTDPNRAAAVLNFGALASGATWIGIVLHVLGFAGWLHALRLISLTEAFSLINICQVFVPAAAWLVLGEAISLSRAFGIALVLGGILLISAPLANAEAKL